MTMTFGGAGSGTEGFQLVRTTGQAFPQVLDAVRREIDAVGMKVLHEIDPQAALAGIGQGIGEARLVFFFHPRLLHRLLQTEWAAIVEVPLKLALLELPEGRVALRMTDPAAAFARYGNPTLATLGQELAAACGRILDASL